MPNTQEQIITDSNGDRVLQRTTLIPQVEEIRYPDVMAKNTDIETQVQNLLRISR